MKGLYELVEGRFLSNQEKIYKGEKIMSDLVTLITNNGIGIVCVAYLIYFQSTTMKSILATLESIDNRLLKIELKGGEKDEVKQRGIEEENR